MNLQRVKIFGAGSIGNHLAHAARSLGCEVVVVDTQADALRRMREDIYPSRYGKWDPAIQQAIPGEAPRGGFDLICVGTPPEYHIPLALQALEESPRALQVEKPLCGPGLEGAAELHQKAAAAGVSVFVGYDHVVGRAAVKAAEFIRAGRLGGIKTLDVEFREHWGGIFQAHPWLAGPADSYLGFWRRGGGASGEHSHALNLWQHLAHVSGGGRVCEVSALVRYIQEPGAVDYDDLCFWQLRTESGLCGRVVQDVVTRPVKKWAFVQGAEAALEWYNGYAPGQDAVRFIPASGGEPELETFSKTRPDDFIEELRHIDAHLVESAPASPLGLDRGLDTMLVVAAAHRSQAEGRRIELSSVPTYTPADLTSPGG